MSVRVTKLERTPEGYWTANLTVDGVTYPVQKASGSWQTPPDSEGVTQGVLPWAAAHLQDRLTAVQLEQSTDEKEREHLRYLRSAALDAVRRLTRPMRKGRIDIDPDADTGIIDPNDDFAAKIAKQDADERPQLEVVPEPVAHLDAARIARRMAAAGRQAAEGGDAA